MENLDIILEKQRQIVKKIKDAKTFTEAHLLLLEFLTLDMQFQVETYRQDINKARELC